MHNLEPKPSFGYINLETTIRGWMDPCAFGKGKRFMKLHNMSLS
jgi:hypothetical protein